MPYCSQTVYGKRRPNFYSNRSLSYGHYNIPKVSIKIRSFTKASGHLSKPLWENAAENNREFLETSDGYSMDYGNIRPSTGAYSQVQTIANKLLAYNSYKGISIENYAKTGSAVPSWDTVDLEGSQRYALNFFLKNSRNKEIYYHVVQYGIQAFVNSDTSSPYYIDSAVKAEAYMDMMIRTAAKWFWDNCQGHIFMLEMSNETIDKADYSGATITDPPARGQWNGLNRMNNYYNPWYRWLSVYYYKMRAAFPQLKLILNEAIYPGLPPTQNSSKARMMGNFKNLIRRLHDEYGVKFDYVGFQCHWNNGEQVTQERVNNDINYFKQYVKHGVHLTEWDSAYYGNSLNYYQKGENHAKQHEEYLGWCLQNPNVSGVTTWESQQGSNWRATAGSVTDQTFPMTIWGSGDRNATAMTNRQASTSGIPPYRTPVYYAVQKALKHSRMLSYTVRHK